MGRAYIKKDPATFGVSLDAPDDKCIEWPHYRTPAGYGYVSIKGKVAYAHRWVWSHFNGDIKKGMHICHKCDNPSCINIHHLFLGTPADNMADMIAKSRHRHKLTPEQTQAIRDAKEKHGRFYGSIRFAKEFGVSQSRISQIANEQVLA